MFFSVFLNSWNLQNLKAAYMQTSKGLKSWQRNFSNQQFFDIFRLFCMDWSDIRLGECGSVDRDTGPPRAPCTARTSQAALRLRNGASVSSRVNLLRSGEPKAGTQVRPAGLVSTCVISLRDPCHSGADVFRFAFEQENLKCSVMPTEFKNINYHRTRRRKL